MKEKLLELHKNSHSPYSNYAVSAVLVMDDGKELCLNDEVIEISKLKYCPDLDTPLKEVKEVKEIDGHKIEWI